MNDSSAQFLSQLYAQDAPGACLLAQYPSSNSDDTIFQNRTKFQIHDPFPPPKKELLQTLGPHHLMCAWGDDLPVTSQVRPDARLLDHWRGVLGVGSVPQWQPFDASASQPCITLFPHESLPANRQVIDPEVNYRLHSKEVIAHIDCPQAAVLDTTAPPCIVKLSHGYAGLGNFMIQTVFDESMMREQVAQHWPEATLVVTSIIENIVSDVGVQFYLRRSGEVIWLGLTEQQFNAKKRWSGGIYSGRQQREQRDALGEIVRPAAAYLHRQGCFGLVGIDVLTDVAGQQFLVDVNPRLTGVSPFLMASRQFEGDGADEGVYVASQRFAGPMDALFAAADAVTKARVLVLSAYEDVADGTTICHLSVSSDSQANNRAVLDRLLTTIS